jgi:hypothetical protein
MRYVVILASLLVSCARPAPMHPVPKLAEASELVWLGIDYSGVKMVGITGFNKPDEIFPGQLREWNGLFLNEMLGELHARVGHPVRADVDAVMAKNRLATKDQIVESASLPGDNLQPEDVARMVGSYDLAGRAGVGLVLVMDVMLKHEERACLYTTFVDLGSRSVLESKRVCHRACGIGFRNFWFSPIKEAVRTL